MLIKLHVKYMSSYVQQVILPAKAK